VLVDVARTLSRSQAARELAISGERVSQMIRLGQLQAIDSPLGKLIPRAEIERVKSVRDGRAMQEEAGMAIASR
jgi:hypothetical protein